MLLDRVLNTGSMAGVFFFSTPLSFFNYLELTNLLKSNISPTGGIKLHAERCGQVARTITKPP